MSDKTLKILYKVGHRQQIIRISTLVTNAHKNTIWAQTFQLKHHPGRHNNRQSKFATRNTCLMPPGHIVDINWTSCNEFLVFDEWFTEIKTYICQHYTCTCMGDTKHNNNKYSEINCAFKSELNNKICIWILGVQ